MSWVIAKLKNKELELFKKNMCTVSKNKVTFYQPKFQYEKITIKKELKLTQQLILGNYIFCKSDQFLNISSLQKFKYIKGLEYFLNDSFLNQKDIISFINLCVKFEDKNGNLLQEFFSLDLNKHYKFVSGSFKDFAFTLIADQKKKLQILMNNKKVSFFKNSRYLVQAE